MKKKEKAKQLTIWNVSGSCVHASYVYLVCKNSDLFLFCVGRYLTARACGNIVIHAQKQIILKMKMYICVSKVSVVRSKTSFVHMLTVQNISSPRVSHSLAPNVFCALCCVSACCCCCFFFVFYHFHRLFVLRTLYLFTRPFC